ncbi:MAG: DNRLRE domain-containing protein [Phycisphaerae bacterium]
MSMSRITIEVMVGMLFNIFAPDVLAGTVTKTFQNNGTYIGCADTYLQADVPTYNYGAKDRLLVAGVPVTPVRAALIRFDNLFGEGAGQIPTTGVIVNATLSMTAYIRTTSDTSQYIAAYPMLKDWVPGTGSGGDAQDNSSCMNARHYRFDGNYAAYPADAWGTDGLIHTGPVQGTDYPGNYAASCLVNPTGTGTIENDYTMTWNITSLVQGWKTTPSANFGLYLCASASGVSVYLRSSEYTNNANQRPLLTIEYLPFFSLSGTVDPQYYTSDRSDLGVKIQLIPQGDGVFCEKKMFLGPAGQFAIDNVTPGTYKIAVKVGGWLRKVLPARSLTETTNLDNISLIGGDCDGDNETTSTDMSIVLTHMDLKGD